MTMLLLLTVGCADIAFTLGTDASARPTSHADTGADDTGDGTPDDTAADDTAADDTAAADTSAPPPPLASIYGLGDIVATPSVYYADWISVGDVNGDGLADLVASVFGDSSWTPGHLVHDFDLVLSDGAGGYTLTTAALGVEGDMPVATVVADFDGDGRADLAASHATGVSVFRFDGTTMTDQVDFLVGDAHRIRAGDLDGDGDVDLVSLLAGEVLVLLNDGSGGFTEGARVPASNTFLYAGCINQLRLGDFDSDGILDLFNTGDRWYGIPAQVNLGVGDGTFGAAITSFPDMPYAQDLSVGDFDGDGANEIAVLDQWSMGLQVGEWTGTVSSLVSYGVPFYGADWIVQADVDGDGGRDLLGFDGYTGAVLLQESAGLSWQPVFTTATGGITGIVADEIFAAGDADGDGCDDLFVYDAGDGYRLSLSQAAGCGGSGGEDTAEDTGSEDTGAEDTDGSAFTGDEDAHRRPGCNAAGGSTMGALGVLLAAFGARRRRG